MARPNRGTVKDALPGELSVEDSYLLAVSGGRDSMALLHRLHAAGFRHLSVCHLNHCLRGEASNLDAELVEKTAGEMGLPFYLKEEDIAARAKENGQSLETAAREARYEFFAEVAETTACSTVILAHHADDQIETVLMKLFRGAGPTGLSGMDLSSERTIKNQRLTLRRPLLQVYRSEIERYVVENEIPFREDESNGEMFALRNRVRHRLVPILNEVFERDIRSSVLGMSELQRKMAAAIDELVPESTAGALDVSSLGKMPEAIRDKVILDWLRENSVPDCGSKEVCRVIEMALSKDKPAKVNLPGDVHARRRAGVVFLEFPEGWE